MECTLKLTEVDIASLASFLIVGVESGEPYDIDQPKLPPDEMETLLPLSEIHSESRRQVNVFGDDYSDVLEKARQHVSSCESCHRFYSKQVQDVAQFSISDNGAESLDEAMRDLDGEWLGILYDD